MDIESKILRKIIKNQNKAEIVVFEPKSCPYLYLKPNDKLNYINNRLMTMKKGFLQLLEIEQFEPVTYDGPGSFFTYGFITTERGEKNNSEIFIQNTLDQIKTPVKLNLSQLERYSLYNGVICALKGKNSKGNEILVENIYTLPVINASVAKKENLNCAIAKGPYKEENLEVLFNLNLEVIILLGPFTSFEDSFIGDFYILNEILEKKLKRNMHTKIILIPSLEDIDTLKILPQPLIPLNSSRIYSLSNPGCLYINGHLICIENYDSLMEISASEYYKEGKSIENDFFSLDRTSRLSHYLIFQKSFLPVFPSKFKVSYSEKLNMDTAPDLLIVSSKLKEFYRDVGPSYVVNIESTNNKYTLIYSKELRKYNIENHNFN